MKNSALLFLFIAFLAVLSACNNENSASAGVTVQPSSKPVIPPPAENENDAYDTQKGTGKFTNVILPAEPDMKKATIGKTLFESVCSSCHRLTDDMIAGPGLKDVTKKFKPEWILNVITNTTQMQQVDPRLKSKAEFYQVKMPELGLSEEQALSIYEYLRTADSKK